MATRLARMAHELYDLLRLLDDEAFLYRVDRSPPDAVTISLILSDERLEITVADDGTTHFVRFTGDDNIGDASAAVARVYQTLRKSDGADDQP